MRIETIIIIMLALFFISLALTKLVPGAETICEKTIMLGNHPLRYCP
jgi:hypothetical protein